MPNDIKLHGPEETFQEEVAYDMLELYGKIKTTREITLRRK